MTVINESFTAKGYTPASQVPGRNIEHIDIHHWGERGQTHDGVVAFFCTTGPGATSAHYVVSAGRIDCIVSDADVAWHSGVWSENLRSIGIECRPEATDADYETVAELVRVLRARYGDLPLHGHREFFPTACPGVWDLARLDRLARSGTITPQSAPIQEWYLMPSIPKDNLLQIAAAVNNAKFRQAIRDEVLGAPIVSTDGKKWPLRAHIQGNTKRAVQTLARLEGLEEVVRQLAAGQGVAIDYEKVEQAVKDALADSDVLKAGDVVDVSVNVQGKP